MSRLVLLAMVLMHAGVFAQEEKIINLEHADTLNGTVIDGENVRELIGHVRITQDNVVIQCDRAVQFVAKGKIVLTGNVTLEQDSMTITAPRGVYYRDLRRAEAFGGVTLDDGISRLEADYGVYDVDPRTAFFRHRVVGRDTGSVLTADSLAYDRGRKYMHAMGAVVLYNQADAMTISGGDFDHDGLTGYSRMKADPVLVKIDTAAAGVFDTLVVRSRVMEAYQDSSRRLLAIDSVEIIRRDLAGRAGLVRFFMRGDSIHFRQAPVLWYQETQVTGDSLTVYLRSRALERIAVMGNAFAVSKSDSAFADRFDQMVGDWMMMWFSDRKLQRIEVDSRAISLYHLYDDSLANGLNKTSGDRIEMLFEKGKARSIRVLGGVEGQYYPETMVRRRERDYALPGLRWRLDRPAIRAADVGPSRTLHVPLSSHPPAAPGRKRGAPGAARGSLSSSSPNK